MSKDIQVHNVLDSLLNVNTLEELAILTPRDLYSCIISYTKDNKVIQKFITLAESKVFEAREELKAKGSDVTDTSLNIKERKQLLINTIEIVKKSTFLSDDGKAQIGELEFRMQKPNVKEAILLSLNNLNYNIVANFNHYPYFEIMLNQILQNIDDYNEFHQTIESLRSVNPEHRKMITLKGKLLIMTTIIKKLKDNNYKINAKVYAYTAFITKWHCKSDPLKKLIRKILNLSENSFNLL